MLLNVYLMIFDCMCKYIYIYIYDIVILVHGYEQY